ADGRLRQLPISGTAHDIFTDPVQFTNQPNAYMSVETLEWLGFGSYFDELHIIPAGDTTDKENITAVANTVQNKLERAGYSVYFTWIPEPGEHPANEVVDPLLSILGILGVLALGASGFLVVNIINGLLAQHTEQIGIMKAVGARSGQIMQMYFVTVVMFGLLSLLVAVPLGALAAYGLTTYIAGLINFDLEGFRLVPSVMIVQTAVAVLTPVLAAAIPVIRGARLTVREAFSEYGLGKGQFGSHMLDRFVEWVSGRLLKLSRPMRISLRNTIRRKARLLLTLTTLTLGGAIFIGVLSVHASLLATLDDALGYFNYDVEVSFDRTYRLEIIEREAMKIPGVTQVESWIPRGARRIRPDESESESIFLVGTEAETDFIKPTLLGGRWLLPDDQNGVVVNSLVLKDEDDIKLGDTIRLKIDEKEYEWEVVGIVQGVMTGPIIYANRPYLAKQLRIVDRSGWVLIQTDNHDPAYQAEVARQLKERLVADGLQVGSTSTIGAIRETIVVQFNIIVVLLAVMAILIALVGGLGLMGTMSINVLERTREIGVMRAVGANDNAILRIVLVEGVVVGVISWLAGGLLALPMGKLLSNVVGVSLLESPLSYRFATTGAFGWLFAVLVIAMLASYLPARNASRYSIRETLAYE
ncbi:MAG: FtsX-like permease family protein, partial [Anaerolineales bacterium]|nr:FtsX-like permease family protein [Anaerolineales bacterium]